MFNKKINNITFILLSLILIGSIIGLNYYIDPYGVFDDTLLQSYPNDIKMLNIKIKLSKNKKYENLLVGSSDLKESLSYLNGSYILSINGINYKNYYQLLENYLKLHPETKHVYISLSYGCFYSDGVPVKIKEFKNEKLTSSDIYRVLFSITALKDSILLLYRKFTPNDNNSIKIESHPFLKYNYFSSDDSFDETLKVNYEYLNKIINFLNEKDVDYTFFILPYNSLPLALLYTKENRRNHIENLKRYVVKKSKNPVYDMAFVNIYTKNDLKNDKFPLYYDYMHPNPIIGIKVFKLLFDREALENHAYIVLTQENIDKQIKYENDLIEDYIEKNKLRVEEFELEQKDPTIPNDVKYFSYDYLPEEFKNDFIYLNKKIEQNNI